MKVLRAAWICPIAGPPIHNGWIAIDQERIAAIGTNVRDVPAGRMHDLGRIAVLPGLINAHTHLELSWLRGRVPPAPTFIDWIKQLFVTRGGRVERPDDPKVVEPARQAVRELIESGVTAVGDISNSLASVELLKEASVHGVVFHELLGFNLSDGRLVDETRPLREAARAAGGDDLAVWVAPHACYSVSPALFRAIREELNGQASAVTSIHTGESESEMEFLDRGAGQWPGLLRLVGAWVDGWQPPGCGPVEFLETLQFLDRRTLVVHGVQLSDESLRRLAAMGCTLVTCPRSNQWVGVGVPPIERFYASGVPVAVGTDSLASVGDLNLFSELKTMRWLAPSIPARTLLESATLVGARALGLADRLGSITAGKRAKLIAVDLPPGVDDVEEYLVSGIEPRQVKWV